MNIITHVVFDLGNVLIDFSFEPFYNFIRAHGVDINSDTQTLYESIAGLAFECGQISTQEFVGNICKKLPSRTSHKAIVQAWNNIFNANNHMLSLLKQTRRQIPVFVLSNTNTLHWQYVMDEYNLANRVDGMLTSFDVGYMKPDIKIYRAAEQLFELAPQTTLFIDDKPENVKGAKAAGWHSFIHTDVKTTCDNMLSLGINVSPTLLTQHRASIYSGR